MPSQSVLSLSRTVQAVMAVAPFADLALTLQPLSGEWDSTEMVYVPISVENRSNATCPSARLEGYVDGQLTVSVLIPKLLAREFWQVDLPIGFHSGGSHEVLMKVDATDEIAEVDETNNSDSLTFVVLVRDPEVPLTNIRGGAKALAMATSAGRQSISTIR
jgi:subtilase family serine protease